MDGEAKASGQLVDGSVNAVDLGNSPQRHLAGAAIARQTIARSVSHARRLARQALETGAPVAQLFHTIEKN
jgi:hypothetical protein